MAETSPRKTIYLPLPNQVQVPIEQSINSEQVAEKASPTIGDLLWAGYEVLSHPIRNIQQDILDKSISIFQQEYKARENFRDTEFIKNRLNRLHGSVLLQRRELYETKGELVEDTDEIKAMERHLSVLQTIEEIKGSIFILSAENDRRNKVEFFQPPSTTEQVMGNPENADTIDDNGFDAELWSGFNQHSDE